MTTEKSKVHKTHSYTRSHLKNKDSLPSYQDISSRVSPEVDNNIQSDEKLPQEFLDNIGTAQKIRFWNEINKRDIKNENEKMKLHIMYLRK